MMHTDLDGPIVSKQDWKRVSDLNREFKYYFSNSIKSIIDRKKGSKLLITDFMNSKKNFKIGIASYSNKFKSDAIII